MYVCSLRSRANNGDAFYQLDLPLIHQLICWRPQLLLGLDQESFRELKHQCVASSLHAQVSTMYTGDATTVHGSMELFATVPATVDKS